MPEQSEARDGARTFKRSAYIIKHALASLESSRALASWVGVQGLGQRGVGEECVTPGPSCSQSALDWGPQRVLGQGAPHLDSGVTCSLTKEIIGMKKLCNV